MTQLLNRPAPPDAARADPALGQISFRLRIGVTGHRDLPDGDALANAVNGQLARLVKLLREEEPEGVLGWIGQLIGRVRKKEPTAIELTVVSRLADGADRLVVDKVLAFAEQQGLQARLEVVLPMHRDEYARSQNWDGDSLDYFKKRLDEASHITEPRRTRKAQGQGEDDDDEQGRLWETAARRLIADCDILLALWDGEKTRGRGGTAETLLEAASLRKACVWIPTHPDGQVRDNFGPGQSWRFQHFVASSADVPACRARSLLEPADLRKPNDEDVLHPLRESVKLVDRYNGEELPATFGARLQREFSHQEEEERWIAPFFLRATILAGQYQTRFTKLAWAITFLAIAAAAVLGVHLTMNDSSAWDWAEVASLLTLTAVFVVLNRGEFHDRWISYRFLAERLRSARFLIPAGVDFPRSRPTVTAYVERDQSNWIQRTFDEFSMSERAQWHDKRHREHDRPGRNQPADKAAAKQHEDVLKQRLADQWIGAQISYHSQRFKEHHRWQWLLLATILVLFAAAVICAILDASGVGRSVTAFLSVLLPAAAASLGALLTVRQDRQLAERSDQISNNLQEAQWQIRHADDHGALVSAAFQAARVMAEENEDWLGALWFLDVEHPG